MNTQKPGKTTIALFAVSALLAMTACKVEVSSDEAPAAAEVNAQDTPQVRQTITPAVPALQGTSWWVEDIAGKGVIDASHTTLDFTRAGVVAGDTGCNRYTARAQLGEGTIKLGNPGGSRKSCTAALMNQEMAFYEAFGKVVSWEIADTGILYLRDAEGNDLMRASATDDP